jgi:serine kinase of HPr protein (carbohydrate metabolism regulator)
LSLVIVPIVAETEDEDELGVMMPIVADTVEVRGVGLMTLEKVLGVEEVGIAEMAEEVGVEVEMLEENGNGRLWQGGQLPHCTFSH